MVGTNRVNARGRASGSGLQFDSQPIGQSKSVGFDLIQAPFRDPLRCRLDVTDYKPQVVQNAVDTKGPAIGDELNPAGQPRLTRVARIVLGGYRHVKNFLEKLDVPLDILDSDSCVVDRNCGIGWHTRTSPLDSQGSITLTNSPGTGKDRVVALPASPTVQVEEAK